MICRGHVGVTVSFQLLAVVAVKFQNNTCLVVWINPRPSNKLSVIAFSSIQTNGIV